VVGGVGFAAEATPHVVWRLRAAERVAVAYGPAPNLAVAAVAGSVGAGLADRWSDLELDCYWREPPSDEDRRGPIRALGVDLEGFWDYDEDEEEWSEVYQLGPLAVTISNFKFSPGTETVKSGTKVTVTNNDSTAHTATSNDGSSFDTGDIDPGSSKTITVSKPGTYAYHCTIHSFMHGTLVVQ